MVVARGEEGSGKGHQKEKNVSDTGTKNKK